MSFWMRKDVFKKRPKVTTVNKPSLPKVMSRMTAKKSNRAQIHSHKPPHIHTHTQTEMQTAWVAQLLFVTIFILRKLSRPFKL